VLQFEFLWAILLLPLPIVVFWLTGEYRDTSQALRTPVFKRVINLTGQTPETVAVALRKGRLQKANGLVSWILIVIALAKPVWVDEPIVQEISARDMLLIVDLSGSMEEKDFTDEAGKKITRLNAVKLVLADFINRREGDRVGLAVFGNAAFPQAPFTTDHATVLSLLNDLQSGMAGPRTMIGDAIGLAIRLFEPAVTENKVVILLTDGNDTGSQMPVSRASEIALQEGITIHTIAIGDPANVGENAMNTDVLQAISKTTGGSYFTALDRISLLAVYDELDRLEPQKLDSISYRPKRQYFHYPLAVMIICNLLLTIVMLRTSGRRENKHA